MITNLNQLSTGQPWPPTKEIADRISMMEKYQLCFHGEHMDVYEEQFKRVARVVGNFEEICTYGIMLNYHKRISQKTSDLFVGESPDIEMEVESKEKTVDDMLYDTDFWQVVSEGIIDVSRYGQSVLKIYKDEDKACIDIVPAKYWIPVVDPSHIKKIVNHVLAWVIPGENKDELHLQIHYKGYYEYRVHVIDKPSKLGTDVKIGQLISEQRINTGLDDFAVIPLSNSTSSDSIYGISDYEDLDSIISELEVRVSQIAKILDKHADPSVAIPECAVDFDPITDRPRAKMAKTFIMDGKDSFVPQYITWESELKANFEQINLLLEQLATLSELGSLFISNGLEKMGNISGIALKKMAYSAMAKINRLRVKNEKSIIKAIKLTSQLSGQNISNEKVSVIWPDVMPTLWQEEIEYFAAAVKAGIMSRETAISRLNNKFTEEQIVEEIAKIDKAIAENGGKSNEGKQKQSDDKDEDDA